MSNNKKWVEKMSSQCGLSERFLQDVLEELSESCFGDSKTAKSLIEELTLSCHMDKEELSKFIGEVSKSCPMDAKKLLSEVTKAKGKKDAVFEAPSRVESRVFEREGVQ